MLEQIKQMALQQLQSKMQSNSLNNEETEQAAQEGVGALLESIKGGNLSEISAIFGGDSSAAENNQVVQTIQEKLRNIFQSKGMDAAEAKQEANNTASHVVNSLKDKFLSPADADKNFDLSQLASLVGGGDLNNLMNKAKGLFGS